MLVIKTIYIKKNKSPGESSSGGSCSDGGGGSSGTESSNRISRDNNSGEACANTQAGSNPEMTKGKQSKLHSAKDATYLEDYKAMNEEEVFVRRSLIRRSPNNKKTETPDKEEVDFLLKTLCFEKPTHRSLSLRDVSPGTINEGHRY